jgi:signal transduction histidine kinase
MVSSVLFAASAYDSSRFIRLEKKTTNIVEDAYAFVMEHSRDMKTVQQAFEKEPRFIDSGDELYVFMHAYSAERKEAICIAQGKRPALIGKNMWGLRTPTGRLLFQEVIELIEKKNEFWLEYDWLNPYTNKIGIKRSLFKKVILDDGRSAWVGCGYWKE